MTPAEAAALVPLAAELVGAVHDYGPEAVEDVLGRVPAGRHDALAVVLAAMVNPDRTAAQLLAWTEFDPYQRAELDRLVNAGVSSDTAATLAARRPRRRVVA